jgi:hypothetical protein
MTDKWETNVGQLRLVNAERRENPTNLLIAERRAFLPGGGRGKGRLHILVELSGAAFGREELAQDLAGAIAEEYFGTPGTITNGLKQSILLANTYLLRSNARVSDEHRVGGVACVVLRGSEAFIAQAGWPMVYLIHGDRVEAFPDTTLYDEDTTMLGQRQTTEVRLFRAAVHAGDILLVVDGPMARQLGITRIGQIVSGGVQQAMKNLEILAPPEDCSAMVIQVGSSARPESEQWTFTPVETPPATVEREEQESAAASPASPFRVQPSPPPAEARPHGIATEPAPRSGTSIGDRLSAAVQAIGGGVRTLGERMLPDRASEAEAEAEPPVEQTEAQRPRTEAQRAPAEVQRPPTPRPRRTADTTARRAAARKAARQRRPSPRQRERGAQARQINMNLALAIAIPILIALSVWGYNAYRNWSQQSQFKTYLETAQLKREIAISSAESPTVARDYWLEVLTNLEAAESLQAEQPEVQEMRAEAEKAVDRIDGVTRLGQVAKIYEYRDPGSTPSRIVVAGLDVYVLDRGTGRVYHHALNEVRNALRAPDSNQVLIEEAQPVDEQNVGSLIDIAWMRNGGERQAGALFILDRNGLLVEYDPSWEQFGHQLLGGQDGWRSPVAVRTFDSHLYVLDPMANQIFKYWNEKYTAAPDRWMQSDIDLSTATDLGIDGSIYVLRSSGVLEKYHGGQPAEFQVTRLPRPLDSGTALYVDVPEVAQYTYIADASGKRIVQLDREGTFVRQLQPALGQEDLFQGISGVFVDEPGAKLYCVAANALYVVDLPPVQP